VSVNNTATFESLASELEAIRVVLRGVLLALGATPADSGPDALLDATARLASLLEEQQEMLSEIESLSKGIGEGNHE